ncbi:class I SAM-dependent methyltransferase [candidate division KSB1 bacterium]|nr:class I SAM-dependent methyltransferase [candidate division KSB1 bacterium]
MSKIAQHSRQVWEDFWVEKQDIGQVYSNADRVIKQIIKLGPCEKKFVMEIGAGSGRDGFKLVDRGAIVILLDYAESSLSVLKKLSAELNKPVFLIRADAFHLPFKSDVLDIVFHQGLLEHFTNPQDLLKENYRVLKPGGFAVADVPQRYHFYTIVKHVLIWLNRWFAGWETEFSINQLKRIFSATGFLVHDVYGDWMRPSFLYRVWREVLKKFNINIALYPKPVPVLSGMSDFILNRFRNTKFAYYTFMDIGVIGIKKKVN